MSEAHLTDLRKVLEQNGNEYDISDVWVVERPDGTGIFHLEFEGLDDLNVLPISWAYGCRVQENNEICAYFARSGRSWHSELENFIKALNEWST